MYLSVSILAFNKVSTRELSKKEKHRVDYVFEVDICGRVGDLLEICKISTIASLN